MVRKNIVLLAIVFVGFMFVAGCATPKRIKQIVDERITPLQAQITATNAGLGALVGAVNENFATVQGDMATMREQIDAVGGLAADAGHKAGAAILKISSVYEQTEKVKASVGAASKKAEEARVEAAKAHAELSAKTDELSKKVADVNTNVSDTRADLVTRVDGVGVKVGDTKKVVDATVIQVGDIDRKVDGIVTTTTRTDATASRTEGAVSALNGSVAAVVSTTGRIEGVVTAQGITLNNATSAVSRVEGVVSTIPGTLTGLATQVGTAGNAAANAESAAKQASIDATTAAGSASNAEQNAVDVFKVVCDIKAKVDPGSTCP